MTNFKFVVRATLATLKEQSVVHVFPNGGSTWIIDGYAPDGNDTRGHGGFMLSLAS